MRIARKAVGVLVLAAIYCAAPDSALAQTESLRVRSALEPQEVELGRSLVIRISATHKLGERVLWPEAASLGPAFAEIARRSEAGPERDGMVTSQLYIEAMVFDLYVRHLPPLAVGLEGVADSVVQTRSLPLRVLGRVDVASSELRPLTPPIDVPVRNTRLLLMLGAGPVLFMLIVLGYSFYRRRPEVPTAAAASKVPRLPAYEEAMARFEVLEVSGLLEEADLKGAFLAMSEIVRDYLGRRYEFSSLDLTTAEIRSQLAGLDAEGEPWTATVVDWLSGCDLVKFAKSAADSDEARDALERARSFVELGGSVAPDKDAEVTNA